jgi:hypothetical protein
MFRNHRSRWIVAMVVLVLLVSALPAAAGPTKARTPTAGWEKLVSQVIALLIRPWKGLNGATASPDTSSYIDPLGQH